MKKMVLFTMSVLFMGCASQESEVFVDSETGLKITWDYTRRMNDDDEWVHEFNSMTVAHDDFSEIESDQMMLSQENSALIADLYLDEIGVPSLDNPSVSVEGPWGRTTPEDKMTHLILKISDASTDTYFQKSIPRSN